MIKRIVWQFSIYPTCSPSTNTSLESNFCFFSLALELPDVLLTLVTLFLNIHPKTSLSSLKLHSAFRLLGYWPFHHEILTWLVRSLCKMEMFCSNSDNMMYFSLILKVVKSPLNHSKHEQAAPAVV